MTPFESAKFGKYLLLDRIAVGGMAELYRAMITGAEGFEKLIAIKKLLSHLTAQENLVNAFIEEAKLAALLQHQNIVQIYDFGCMDGDYFIAMEHLFGKDLRLIMDKSEERGRPLTLEYALYIASRVCEGLDYAHHLKDLEGNPLHIIHRDISPPNIIITYEGEVKIVDFGIAKAATQNTATMEGVIKGKVSYMSPEQAGGESIDQRSDIFSTGILIYEMLTGKRMFDGEPLQVLPKVREAEFEPLDQVVKDLPPELYDIVHRALAKEPDQRYQSSGDMLCDVEECMHKNGLRVTARVLSQYMRDLFKEEIAAEEGTLRETAQIQPVDNSEASLETQALATKREKTKALSADELPAIARGGKNRYRAIAVFALVVIGVVFALQFKEGAVWQPEKADSVSTVKPSNQGKGITGRPSNAGVSKPETAEAKPVATEKLEAGLRALREERYPEAVALFEDVLAREPVLKTEVSRPYAQALVGQASLLAEHFPGKAEALFLKAIKSDPTSVQAHFQLGHLYVKQKEYIKAIGVYESAAKLDPQFSETYFNLAFIYAVKKEYAKAEEMYNRVVELAPPYVDEALYNLALVQERQGKRAESIKNLEKALKINPKNEMAKKYLLRIKRDSGKS
jgi:tetratricopeptide (TPR) repeat protein/tRNA A-37 threonylcarbamoyl transferase component Bud32